MIKAEQILFSQGFGTRNECRGIICGGRFKVGGKVIEDPETLLDPAGLTFSVDDEVWPYYEKAIVLLNKPAGYECSLKPIHHPSVISLLPPPLRTRKMQPVGRLDQDTTGLLLFTDNGQLLHKLTHPKRHIDKVYKVTCVHPVTDSQIDKLLKGVVLKDSDETIRAVACSKIDDKVIELTVDQGKYHQVKRMLSAVSNRVESLERIKFGKLVLPSDLALGHWIWIDSEKDIY